MKRLTPAELEEILVAEVGGGSVHPFEVLADRSVDLPPEGAPRLVAFGDG